jgi:hypothetical protein
MTPATLHAAPAAEPTMVAVAIAKMDSAASPIAARVAQLRNSRQWVMLPSAEWHAILNDLAGARAALRTQQAIAHRDPAAVDDAMRRAGL